MPQLFKYHTGKVPSRRHGISKANWALSSRSARALSGANRLFGSLAEQCAIDKAPLGRDLAAIPFHRIRLARREARMLPLFTVWVEAVSLK